MPGGSSYLLCLLTLLLQSEFVLSELQLVILHTGDVHGRVEQFDGEYEACSQEQAAADECYGGVARRATVIKQLRQENENVLLLDTGDQFFGSLWFSQYLGLEASHFMNRLGYDAMVRFKQAIV